MEQDVPTSDEALPQPPASPPATPIEIEKEFILTFESLPELWDKTHNLYCNKYKRNDALQKLLNIYVKIKPGATIEDVKKKLNILRSNYRRELKKIISSRRSGCSTDDIYCPKSWTFEYLKFLDKFEQPVPVDRVSDGNHNDADSDQAQTEQEVAATISSFVSAPQPARPPPLRSKKSVHKTQNELLERACNYLSEPQVSGARSIAFDWAETLERLTSTQRLYAKKAINDVLFEAELGNLHRYSVQINVTSTPSPAPSPYYTSPPESSFYSHTTSLDYIQSSVTASPAQSPIYIQTPVTAPPAQSPNYIQTPVTAPPAHSSNNIQIQGRAPPAQSPIYIQTPVTAPPAQSPNYIQTPVTAPPAHSSNNIQIQGRAPPAQSPIYIQTPVTAPPAQSPNYIQTPVTAPPAHSSNNIQIQGRAPPAQSPIYIQTPVTAPPAQPPNYIQTPVTAPPAYSFNNIQTQVRAPPAQSPIYTLHIPSTSSMSQDSEYTAGSLFAQFQAEEYD